MPESLESIGYKAFAHCSSLTRIELPASLTRIRNGAFTSCSNVTRIDLSGCTSLTSIGKYAFTNCTNAVVTLPNKADIAIGSNAFGEEKDWRGDCTWVKAVQIPSENDDLKAKVVNSGYPEFDKDGIQRITTY